LLPDGFSWASLTVPALATLVGWAGAALGVWLTGMRQRARVVVPFSAGVLLGVAVFGLAPELAVELGWVRVLELACGGYGALLLIDRFVYPVCPACAHHHEHTGCEAELHGFAAPLIAAAAAHSFLDGWSVATAQFSLPLGLRIAVPLAIALHKAPEGVALGGILRAAMASRAGALGWCLLAEGATLAGGAAGMTLVPYLGTAWITYPLGLAAGWLFYLGWHAVQEEWKSRGARPAFLSALTGMAGAAALQRGAEALFR
jgi:zinc transporter ZupT